MAKEKSFGIKVKDDGVYKEKGDYHRNLDKNWKYYPVYVHKMNYVRSVMDRYRTISKIVDLGCGEGVLVEEYRNKGYDITGVDYNFSSDYVLKGDITNLEMASDTYDLVMALDILEHLIHEDQPKAIQEIKRILKPDGLFLASIPNLAHFASRLSFSAALRAAKISR